MTLLLTAQQCFFIVILAFAVVGFQRGWKRELVSLGFSLAAVLFLYLGGGEGMAQLIFVRLPVIVQIAAGSPGSQQNSTEVTPTLVLLTTIITFAVVVTAGYLVGNRAFPRPATPQERLFGILPAIVGGYFMLLYLTYVVKSPLITVGVRTPSQSDVGGDVVGIFVIVVVVVVVGLIASNVKKGPPPKK